MLRGFLDEWEDGLLKEIRFHGMGGQGAVMGALILAEALFSEGKYSQKIPVYGAMRRGGSVTVFLRIDDKPIRRTCGIYEPDCIVVLDPLLPKFENVTEGLKKDGIALLNNPKPPEEVDLGVEVSTLATVDATGVSIEVFGERAIPITNTTMLGALSRVTGWVKLESLFEPIKKTFPGRIGERNVIAARMGYDRVKVMKREV